MSEATPPDASAEARRLIDALEWQTKDEKAALLAYVAGLEAEVARLREAAEDMAWQFAHAGSSGGRLVLSTGGLSALENAFDALGWPDPKPCPERECEAPDCYREATTGTPTADGYKRLCFEHYRALGTPAVARGTVRDRPAGDIAAEIVAEHAAPVRLGAEP